MVKMKSQRVEIKVICKDPSTLESKEDKILLLVDKDRYRIHGFYNKSVLLIFQTPAASPPFPYFSVTVVVSIFWVQDVSMVAVSFEFWSDDKTSLLLTGFPLSSYYSKQCV